MADAQMVSTIIGDIPESDLDVRMIDDKSDPKNWIAARECYYKGSDPALAQHVGKLVKRDAWVTVKCGHGMAGDQAKFG